MIFSADRGAFSGNTASQGERSAASVLAPSNETKIGWSGTGGLRQVLETAEVICFLLFDQAYPTDCHPETDLKVGTGTGFLIGPRLLMTCRHVIPHREAAQHARARFFYDGHRQPLELSLNPDKRKGGFFLTSSRSRQIDQDDLDFTIVALKEPTYAVRYLSIFQCCILKDPLKDNKLNVYVIQHSAGTKDTRTAEEAHQRIADGVIKACEQRVVRYQLKTAGGASGAPVLNEQGQLVALHEKGYPQGSPLLPYGVRMDKIVSYLGEEGKKKIEAYIEQYGREEALLERALKDCYLSRNTVLIFSPSKKQGKWKLELPLEGIYTTLALLKGNQREVLVEQEEDEGPQTHLEERFSAYNTLFESKQQMTMEELFSHENLKDQQHKRVLFLGGAGIGKSTFFQYIAYQWAAGNPGLQDYRAVIWVRLREVKKEDTWQSFLIRKYSNLSLTLLDQQAFRDKTLLLLDGYEEMPTHPEAKQVFDELTKEERFPHLFLTSRPQFVEFDPPCKLEILGFDVPNVNSYVTHFFSQMSIERQDAFSEEEFRKWLEHHPAAWSLAHIPLNLSLLCTLAIEGDDLFKASSVTMTAIYSKIVSWMYKWYLLRLREAGQETRTEEAIRRMENPRYEHSRIKKLAAFLEEIAWDNINQEEGSSVYERRKLNERLVDEDFTLEELNSMGLFRLEDEHGEVYFVHSTFQEFFAACYLTSLYATGRTQAQQWIKMNKFNPRYQIILWMTVGYLAERNPQDLHSFFDDLYESPRDLAKSYELRLMARCFEESRAPQAITHYTVFINQLTQFLNTNSIVALHVEVLRDNPTLLQHQKVIEEIKKWPKEKQLDFIRQLLAIKQTLPSQVIDIVNTCLQDSNEYIKELAVRVIGKIASVGRAVSQPVCLELSACLQHGSWLVRLLAADAFKQIIQARQIIPDEVWSSLIGCLKDPKEEIRRLVAEVMIQMVQAGQPIPNSFWTAVILYLQNEEPIKKTVIQIIRQITQAGTVVPDTIWLKIEKDLQKSDSEVNDVALEFTCQMAKVGQILPPSIWLEIHTYLKSEDQAAKKGVIEMIEQMPLAHQVLIETDWQELRERLQNSNQDIRRSAVWALGQLSSLQQIVIEPTWLELKACLQESDWFIKKAALLIVGRMGQIGQIIPQMIWMEIKACLKDQRPIVIQTGTKAIKQIVQSRQIIPEDVWLGLVDCLKSSNIFVGSPAEEAFEQIVQSKQPVPEAVWKEFNVCLTSFPSFTKQSVVRVICRMAGVGQLIPSDTWSCFSTCLKDTEEEVSCAAFRAIDWMIWSKQLVPETIRAELIVCLKEGNRDVKWSAVRVIGQIARLGQLMPEAVLELVACLDFNEEAAQAIGQMAQAGQLIPQEAWLRLVDYLLKSPERDSLLRFHVIRQIVRVNQKVPEDIWLRIHHFLQFSNQDVRQAVVNMVCEIARAGGIIPSDVWLKLSEGLQDSAEDVRALTAHSLGGMAQVGQEIPEKVWLRLCTCLRDCERSVRSDAGKALGWITQAVQEVPEKVWLEVGNCLKDKNKYHKQSAALSVGEMAKSKQIIPAHIWEEFSECLKDPEDDVRGAAAEALGLITRSGQEVPETVWIGFNACLKDPKEKIKQSVAKAVGLMAQAGQRVPEVVWYGLGECLKDPHDEIRRSTAKAIGQIAETGQLIPENAWWEQDSSPHHLTGNVKRAMSKNVWLELLEHSYDSKYSYKKLVFHSLKHLIQTEKVEVENLSDLLIISFHLDVDIIFILLEIAKKGGKLSLTTLQKLVISTNENEDPYFVGKTYEVLRHLNLQHYDHYDQATKELLIKICFLTGDACFEQDGKLFIFSKRRQIVLSSGVLASR